ncbi:MAG: chromosomal replication initiator protein DnaA [candidate division WOR-3 bacterium]
METTKIDESPKLLWENILSHIKGNIPEESFTSWFSKSRGIELKDDYLLVELPNNFFIDWIEHHYSTIVAEAVKQSTPTNIRIAFTSAGLQNERPRGTLNKYSGRKRTDRIVFSANGTKFSPRYTFDTFVVGKCNQFAHAASLAVAEAPVEAYNPLFIYGGVGLGKTHLMHAIGNFIQKNHSNSRVYYTPAENILNELIDAIQHARQTEFKKKYREKDVLLIDDIQFLHGKERLQEEIFHTFNYLYEGNKQIVISSDRPPKEIPTLEERLRSRFQGGLVVDIQPPDLETRIAILHKKAHLEGMKIPQGVAYYIASRVKSNIRELEGMLIRLFALSSLSGSEINEQLAEEVLKDLFGREQHITKETILKKVSEEFSLPLDEIKGRKRTKSYALARQISMYLIKDILKLSLVEIGQFFGGKDHTTVIHAIKKIEEIRKTDSTIDEMIKRITMRIKGE